ncbi:hypothetical protein BASA50_011221 [Batrachochytrium salamandrivorans]|uniref:Uncharacterized protein n=1 Tax=Batrachochytrium salamandrivorans TaxID=1357716 RepID=A0ABQ8EW52_9FUNG|nr:hypothetical protein BASA50_011221 [Batrachochytrium salamandrivorans]KAH9255883.1 hypothetical protein BASA81_006057 [Batrachochytrium salamandrivorans]
MGGSTFSDIHCQLASACTTCCFCLLLCHVKPCSSPRKSLMQSIKPKLYKADGDQAAVVMARLDEAGQTSLQSPSSSALATKRGLSQQDPYKAQGNSTRKVTI